MRWIEKRPKCRSKTYRTTYQLRPKFTIYRGIASKHQLQGTVSSLQSRITSHLRSFPPGTDMTFTVSNWVTDALSFSTSSSQSVNDAHSYSTSSSYLSWCRSPWAAPITNLDWAMEPLCFLTHITYCCQTLMYDSIKNRFWSAELAELANCLAFR